jgi:uncharacterized protein involved in exopolysaccharide biosynthesis
MNHYKRYGVNSNEPILIERADGIDIVAIMRVMWRYRYLIAAASILFGLIAVYLALTAKEIFRAEVIVSEVHDHGLSGSGGGLSGQIGGLASLAGLNLSGGGADASAQGILASRRLIAELVKSHGLVPQLTANTGRGATLWFAVKRFQETVVAIHDDPVKGLTTVTMDWADPAVAAKLANDFVALANDIIRSRDFEDATRNVAYLNKQIAETREVEIQRSLSGLIESETKKLMLANARTEYAFRIVDPAVAPEIRHSPKRTLWVVSGLALGFFIGTALALGHDAFRKRNFAQ